MASQHTVVPMPSDGNCLFWSTHIGMQLFSSTGGSQKKPAANKVLDAAERLVAASGAKAAVAQLRRRVVEHMRENLSRYETQVCRQLHLAQLLRTENTQR